MKNKCSFNIYCIFLTIYNCNSNGCFNLSFMVLFIMFRSRDDNWYIIFIVNKTEVIKPNKKIAMDGTCNSYCFR